jgi:hypothetical protein
MFRRPSQLIPDRYQHRLAAYRTILPDLLVAGIQNQIRAGLFQSPFGKSLQFLIELLYDPADRRGAELMAAQLFGDGLHLPCRYALYVHLQHRRHQRFLASLIAFEHLCAEAPLPILRHAQIDVAYPRHQHAVVIAGPVSEPTSRALAFARLQRFVHLRFQHLLQRLFHNRFQQIVIFCQQLLQILCRDLAFRAILLSGHLSPFLSSAAN